MAAIFSLARAKKFSDWICEDASALDSSLEINADSLLAYRVLFPLLKSREDVVWILPSGTSFARFASLGKQSGADLTSHFFFMAQDAAQALLGLQQAIRNQAATIVLDMSDGFEGEQYQLLSALERIAQSGISVIAIRPFLRCGLPQPCAPGSPWRRTGTGFSAVTCSSHSKDTAFPCFTRPAWKRSPSLKSTAARQEPSSPLPNARLSLRPKSKAPGILHPGSLLFKAHAHSPSPGGCARPIRPFQNPARSSACGAEARPRPTGAGRPP